MSVEPVRHCWSEHSRAVRSCCKRQSFFFATCRDIMFDQKIKVEGEDSISLPYNK